MTTLRPMRRLWRVPSQNRVLRIILYTFLSHKEPKGRHRGGLDEPSVLGSGGRDPVAGAPERPTSGRVASEPGTKVRR
jgi:hypothetical protein